MGVKHRCTWRENSEYEVKDRRGGPEENARNRRNVKTRHQYGAVDAVVISLSDPHKVDPGQVDCGQCQGESRYDDSPVLDFHSHLLNGRYHKEIVEQKHKTDERCQYNREFTFQAFSPLLGLKPSLAKEIGEPSDVYRPQHYAQKDERNCHDFHVVLSGHTSYTFRIA